MVVPVQVSEGFDGQTRTELLEAGNELDRVRTNFESSPHYHPPPLHDHGEHPHNDDHPPLHDDEQVNHQLGSNLTSQGSRQTLNAAVQR